MKFIITFLFTCLITLTFAQQSFRKSYGAPGYGEYANNAMKLKDGTFVITGSTLNFGAGSFDAFCIRIDENGKTLWAKTFGDSSSNAFTQATATADGNFVMCFTSYKDPYLYGNKFSSLFVVKCNSAGQVLWSISIKSPSLATGTVQITPYQVYESKAGDIYILSDWFSFDYHANYSLTKLDAAGNFKWNSSVSLNAPYVRQFSPVQVIQTDNGDIIVGENFIADGFYLFDDEVHISTFSQQTGALLLGRTIYQNYNDGFAHLSAYGLTIQKNILLVAGIYSHDNQGYGESYFALRPADTEVTLFHNEYSFSTSRQRDSLQSHILHKYAPRYNGNSTTDGGYIYAYDSYDGDYNIIVEKDDSLGHVCTDTAGFYPSISHFHRTLCQVYNSKDYLLPYVFTGTDTTLTVTDVTAEKTLCETFATPLIAQADKHTNTLTNNTSHTGVQLYPNPATDRIAITFETTQAATIQVNVITMQGQTVLTQKAGVGTGKQQVIMNVKTLSPGMYYIKLNGLNRAGVMKFIKQ